MRESVRRLTAVPAEEMRVWGARLADALRAANPREPFVLGLTGDLGTGKTTLVCGLLAALGHKGPQFPSFGKMGIKAIIFLVLAGILAGVVAQLVFYKSLKMGEISRIIPVTCCYPLFSFLLGWIFLGEEITLSKVAGMLLILGGIFLLK